MELKVTYRELDKVNSDTDKNANDLENEIKFWNKRINDLKGIWQGEDANVFYNHMEYYLKKMDRIPIVYQNISNFMKKANIEYENKDEEFAKNLKETAVKEQW